MVDMFFSLRPWSSDGWVCPLDADCVVVSDGELNVLEDILTEAPDQDDELYNPEAERSVSDKKGSSAETLQSTLVLLNTCISFHRIQRNAVCVKPQCTE